MDKYDYVETIMTDLRGTTDINFQVKVGEILKVYYKFKGLIYDMPNSSGGDDKNDGWVKETKLFYQIYSPQLFFASKKCRKLQRNLHRLAAFLLH